MLVGGVPTPAARRRHSSTHAAAATARLARNNAEPPNGYQGWNCNTVHYVRHHSLESRQAYMEKANEEPHQ